MFNLNVQYPAITVMDLVFRTSFKFWHPKCHHVVMWQTYKHKVYSCLIGTELRYFLWNFIILVLSSIIYVFSQINYTFSVSQYIKVSQYFTTTHFEPDLIVSLLPRISDHQVGNFFFSQQSVHNHDICFINWKMFCFTCINSYILF